MMKKIGSILLLFIVGYSAFVFVFSTAHPPISQSTKPPENKPSPHLATIITNPVRLRIPSLQIDTAVEHVGMDSQGRMDIPKKNMDVAWYQLGYKPGEKGNAVFAGHLDTATGAPAIFYHLSRLKPGETISVFDSNGSSLTFTVTKTVNYPDNAFPLQKVFGESTVPQVNIITCEGTWNAASHNYSHRTVVSAVLRE